MSTGGRVFDLVYVRGRTRVFEDRRAAGQALAGLLDALRQGPGIVLAIPAGGVPVGAALAQELRLPLDVAVVSKVTLPWNTEAGYGAVAFDGSVVLNEALLAELPLSDHQVAEGVAATRSKVVRRLAELRGERPLPDLSQRTTILVDDGLASGFTMQAAVRAVRACGAGDIVVAVPTGHEDAVLALEPAVEAVYCANLRGGRRFAVAEAYVHWCDVPDDEVRRILAQAARAGEP